MNRLNLFQLFKLGRVDFCTLILRNSKHFHRFLKFSDVLTCKPSVNMLQKSLLSFFKPRNDSNQDAGTITKETGQNQETLAKKQSKKTPIKEQKKGNLAKKQKEKPIGNKLKEKTSIRKQKEKENESVTKTPVKNEEFNITLDTSPIVTKKRLRIVALESDSEEENQGGHEMKKLCPESPKVKNEEAEEIEMELSENKKTPPKDRKLKSTSTTPKSNSKQKKTNERGKTPETPVNKGKLSEILKKKNSSKKKTPKQNIISNASATTKKTEDISEKLEENLLEKSKRKTNVNKESKKSEETKESKNEEEKPALLEKKDSDDLNDNMWKYGVKTQYLNLAKTLEKLEVTSARLKIIDILSNYFCNVIMSNKDDLLPSIYLCLNTLGPAYESRELGIADTYLMKAVAQCTGRTLSQIKADATKTGDLGIVAEQSRSNQKIMSRPAPLTVQGVFNQLSDIAVISGNNAMQKKIDKIQALFVACRECEARFLIRSLAGKLRIGLGEQSMLQALALACTTAPPNQEHPFKIQNASKTMSADAFKKLVEEELLILKTTYCECPNFNLIVPVLLKEGIRGLPEHCKISPGIPVKPMLAQPTKGVQEVLKRFENIKFTCEWKYDGERAQIHVLENGSIKIYSRNQEDNTSKYPDIIKDIGKVFRNEVKSCILDAEAVAWDREQKKIMPFQVLSTRKRKDAEVTEIKVQVCVFLFDLLYLNGESLTQKTLEERRTLLKEYTQEVEEKFSFVTCIDTNTMEEVQECLEESVKGNCEGLMVKTLDTDATYEIAKRSRNWLKLKKDYLEGCGDTLDLIVIGGYIGKGKRTGQYGGFLLASYDSENDEYQSICRIGTGFTEEALAAHSEFLKQHAIPNAKPYYRYDLSHQPDQWFDAVQVWEIKCADLSLSPIYYSAIGLVDPEKGISLRFPRFLRVRNDKTVEQATSSKQVAELYQNQDQIKNIAQDTKFNEEDF